MLFGPQIRVVRVTPPGKEKEIHIVSFTSSIPCCDAADCDGEISEVAYSRSCRVRKSGLLTSVRSKAAPLIDAVSCLHTTMCVAKGTVTEKTEKRRDGQSTRPSHSMNESRSINSRDP
jgi:hypothetical protein